MDGKELGKIIIATMVKEGSLQENDPINYSHIEEYLRIYRQLRGKPTKRLAYYNRLQSRIAALDLVNFRHGTCDEHASKIKEGWVYLVTNPVYSGCVKVGKAINVAKRLSSMNVHDPYKGYIVEHCTFSTDRHNLENSLKKALTKYQLSGEWFKVSVEEANSILRRLVQR